MDILIVVGKWIRALRKQNGLSQEELGEKTGLSSNYISLIEHGKKQVTIVTLAGIANALGVSLDAVFSEYPFNKSNPKLEKEMVALNESLRSMEPEDVKALRQLVERLGKKRAGKKK